MNTPPTTSAPPSAPLAVPRRKLWIALTTAAALGALGASPFLLQTLRGIAAQRALPIPVPVLLAVQLLQTLVLTSGAAWLGVVLAPRVGLDAPLFRARLAGLPVAKRLAAELPLALLTGTLAGAAVLLLARAAATLLPAALHASVALPAGSTHLGAFLLGATSAFYGGIIEELLMRWGFLVLLAFVAGKLGAGRSAAFWLGNVLAALLFGAGHLPAVRQLGVGMTPFVVVYIVGLNALAGIAFGWLFRRRGLEAAMMAHAVSDVCLHALPLLFG